MESIMNDLNDVDSETESSSTWILLQIADSGTLWPNFSWLLDKNRSVLAWL